MSISALFEELGAPLNNTMWSWERSEKQIKPFFSEYGKTALKNIKSLSILLTSRNCATVQEYCAFEHKKCRHDSAKRKN